MFQPLSGLTTNTFGEVAERLKAHAC
jgi:hypothetical protein